MSARRTWLASLPLLLAGPVACNALVDLRDIDVATTDGGAPDTSADVAPLDGSPLDGTPADAPADQIAETGPTDAAGDVDAGCTKIPNLVGFWKGENDTKDAVGISNGAWVGGSRYVPGMSGMAFAVNDGSGFVEVPHTPNVALSIPYSISVWVKFAQGDLRAVDKLTNGVNDGYLLDVNNTYGRLISGTGYSTTFNSSPMSPNAWHHLAAVVSATNDRSIYVDGVLASNATNASSPPAALPGITLRFGANSEGTSTFPGAIDEVALFARALTPAQVQDIFKRGSLSLCQ
jgi:hypothetical protein